jgi:hypothetical protein
VNWGAGAPSCNAAAAGNAVPKANIPVKSKPFELIFMATPGNLFKQ